MNRTNMSQTNLLFAAGIAVLVAAWWKASYLVNLIGVGFEFPYAAQVSTGLLSVGVVFGLLALWFQSRRIEQPWRIAPRIVTVSYLLFLVITLSSIFVGA